MDKWIPRMNVILTLVIVALLLGPGGGAIRSGYPFSLLCYNCKACDSSCVLGIDPQGFITSSQSGDPDMYILASNIRLNAAEALARDPGMVITVKGRHITIRQAVESGAITTCDEVMSYRMRARDAAHYCVLCAACEKVCPLSLPLLWIIRDLRNQERK